MGIVEEEDLFVEALGIKAFPCGYERLAALVQSKEAHAQAQ
jgi:hypothetical protein